MDTLLLCSLTALVILVSGVESVQGGGMRFAMEAYAAILGPVAHPILSLSVLLFAFATVLCWAHYGKESLRFLTGNAHGSRALFLALLVACVWGAIAAPQALWDLTDLVLSLMAMLNIVTLFSLRHEVLLETKQ